MVGVRWVGGRWFYNNPPVKETIFVFSSAVKIFKIFDRTFLNVHTVYEDINNVINKPLVVKMNGV